MTTDRHSDHDRADCARFDAQLSAWLERELGAAEQAWMSQHRQHCAACDTVVRELDAIIADASALPPIAVPRDLWPAIEARLEAPVIPLPVAGAPAVTHGRRRSVPVQWFAVAATVLVAVSSGITWQVAKQRNSTAAPGFTATGADGREALSDTMGTSLDRDLPNATTEFAVATPSEARGVSPAPAPAPAGARARLVVADADADDLRDPSVTYEREITALRRIVDERFAELDSSTVTELRRNLDIIDRAISDSRAALARDPRSGVVSSQLDRALQAKLDLLRRVALL